MPKLPELRFVLAVILAIACNRTPRPPVRTVVVCGIAPGAVDACPVAERQAAFETWAREGSTLPGSTFEVWRPSPFGNGAQRVVSICTPSRWHGNALAQRAAFVRQARARAGVPTAKLGPSVTYPSTCKHSARAEQATRQLLQIDGSGRTTARSVPSTRTPGSHASILCDLSSSMRNAPVCTVARVVELCSGWTTSREALVPGSTFSVRVIGRTRDTTLRAFHYVVPSGHLAERLVALQAARTAVVRDFSHPSPDEVGSAIAEAISVAARELLEKQGIRTLTILSDLRQVSGPWQFESKPVPAPRFAEQLRDRSLLSDLTGVEVLVCTHEAHAPGAPPFSAASAAKVEGAWANALGEMHAARVRILTDCDGRLALAD